MCGYEVEVRSDGKSNCSVCGHAEVLPCSICPRNEDMTCDWNYETQCSEFPKEMGDKMKIYHVDVIKRSSVVETKRVEAEDEDEALKLALEEAEEETSWCDFNTSYFEKSVQGITETITEIKPPNGDSYWERKDDMEKFFDKAMEVEDGYKKPH
jgi:hypothetical protein